MGTLYLKANNWFDSLNEHNERVQQVGDILLNLDYWDCECIDDFIHSISRRLCAICGAEQEECPSSRECEVQLFRKHGMLK